MNFLNKQLTEEEQQEFREYIKEWKTDWVEKQKDRIEEIIQEEINRVDLLSKEYESNLKEKYSAKLVEAVEEIKDHMRAEIISEMQNNDPSINALNEIKNIVAPLVLNEEKEYSNQIAILTEKIHELENESKFYKGSERLQELVSDYSPKMQRLLKKLIGEGTEEEIVEKFYNIIEELKEDDSEFIAEGQNDDWLFEQDDEEDEGDDEEEDDEEDDDEEDDEGEDEGEEDDDEVEEEGFKYKGTPIINEDIENKNNAYSKLQNDIKKSIGSILK